MSKVRWDATATNEMGGARAGLNCVIMVIVLCTVLPKVLPLWGYIAISASSERDNLHVRGRAIPAKTCKRDTPHACTDRGRHSRLAMGSL